MICVDVPGDAFVRAITSAVFSVMRETEPPEATRNYTHGFNNFITNQYKLSKFLRSLKGTGKIAPIIPTEDMIVMTTRGNSVVYHSGMLYVGGDTYPYRHLLRGELFDWHPENRLWGFRYWGCVDKLLDKLEWLVDNLPVDVVVVFTRPDQAYVLPAKRFLETLREKIGKIKEKRILSI